MLKVMVQSLKMKRKKRRGPDCDEHVKVSADFDSNIEHREMQDCAVYCDK